MIIDQLNRASLYTALGDRIAAALQFLADGDMTALPLGRHDIDGDNVFALVQEYNTKDDAAVRWEAHQKYIDVQFVASGVEQMGVADLATLNITDPYDAKIEALFAAGPGDKVTLRAGTFIILHPNDAHRPGIAVDQPAPVRKVVVKVAV